MFWAAHGLHCEVQQASYPGPIGLGNLLNSSRDRDRLLQLLVFNEEFLVNASHQLALITSLPFVHTARRSYRLDESMSLLESGRETSSEVERLLKIMQIYQMRISIRVVFQYGASPMLILTFVLLLAIKQPMVVL